MTEGLEGKTMIPNMTCRIMAESDIDLIVHLYIGHYNTYEGGAWTQATTYKRIHQVWSREDSLCMILEQDREVIGFVMGYFEQYDDTERKAHKVFAETIDAVKSVGLMQKLGMQLEGIQRSQTRDNHGNWADLYFHGLLEEDWRKMK